MNCICGQEVIQRSETSYSCVVCGDYLMTREALEDFPTSPYIKHSAKISAYLRKRHVRNLPKLMVFYDRDEAQKIERGICFDDIIKDFPKSISDRIDHVLLNFAKLSTYTGNYTQFTQNDYPVFYAETKDPDALWFMMQQLFNEEYIEAKNGQRNPGLPIELRLTLMGWNRVIELEKGNLVDSQKAFVAMWFDQSMLDIFEHYITKAVSEAGFDPFIIPMKEHNDDICDHIIAEIKSSRFMIADFTGQRGGVYFEAGFAYGRGLPVIWTCREDWFKQTFEKEVDAKVDGKPVKAVILEERNTHFDIDHYNFIVWKNGDDLYKRLKDRILATIVP